MRRLVNMVRRGGGSRYMSLNEKLTHIVVGTPSEREVVGQDGHGRSLCMGTGIQTSTKHVKGSYNKVAEEEAVLLNEKIDVQKELIENQQKNHQEQLENVEKRHNEQLENVEKRHNEQMKNLEKRHRQERAKFYKVLQNAGLVNDDNDAFDNNQDTSDHFSDAR